MMTLPADHPQRIELNDEVHSRPPLPARLQLRLQSTVEGLSVAAVTYYVSALVGHAAEALRLEGVRWWRFSVSTTFAGR